MRRDSNSCVVCGSGDRLHAHHLRGYAEHPESRLDYGNGVALCRKCHRIFHSRYGNFGFGDREFSDCFGFPEPVEDFDPSWPLSANGDIGEAVKHLLLNTVEDLKKAAFYVNREIERRERKPDAS